MIPARQTRGGRSGVLPGLDVVVVPERSRAPLYGTSVGPGGPEVPVPGGQRGRGARRPGPDDPFGQLYSRSGAVLALCFLVVALFGIGQGIQLLLADPGSP